MKKWKVTIMDTETDKLLFDGEVDAILATIIQGDDARSITALKTNTAGVITAIINTKRTLEKISAQFPHIVPLVELYEKVMKDMGVEKDDQIIVTDIDETE